MTIRLLGALAPKTDAGTIAGNPIAAPPMAAVPFRKLLRVIWLVFFIMLS
jgi:hypothetical protein